MTEEKAAPRYVRVMRANASMGATILLLGLVAIVVAVDAAPPITGRVLRTAVVVASVGLTMLFVVRTARLGVYALPEGLQIRGMVRTRMFPWAEVIGTTTRRRTNGRGGIYYLPTLVVRLPERIDRRALVVLPSDQRPTDDWLVGLGWLSAATEKTAQRRARDVQSIIESGRPAD